LFTYLQKLFISIKLRVADNTCLCDIVETSQALFKHLNRSPSEG